MIFNILHGSTDHRGPASDLMANATAAGPYLEEWQVALGTGLVV